MFCNVLYLIGRQTEAANEEVSLLLENWTEQPVCLEEHEDVFPKHRNATIKWGNDVDRQTSL